MDVDNIDKEEGELKNRFDEGELHTNTEKMLNVDEKEVCENESASNSKSTKLVDEVEESPGIKFSPPVYIQRYCRVTEILKENIPAKGDRDKLETVLEVGCAEFSMHVYLSKFKRIGKLIYLDLDEGLLTNCVEKLRPLMIEYIRKRENPLRVEAYAGCVTKIDPIVLTTPIKAVVTIEIVEHLDPDILCGFVKSIFGVVRPELVIITTPNSEFNVCFNMAPGKFRHWDHRFEWTRDEFESWCKSICKTYPSYTFAVEGVGSGPPETASLGCVSQLAIFRNVDGPIIPDSANFKGQVWEFIPNSMNFLKYFTYAKAIEWVRSENVEPGSCFKLISKDDYPFYFDPSPLDVKILREFNYYIQCYLFTPTSIDDYIEEEITEIKFPLSRFLHIHGMPDDVTVEQIQTVLEAADYKTIPTVNDEGESDIFVVLPVPEAICESLTSSESEYDEGDAVRGDEFISAAKTDEVEEEAW